MIRVEFVKVFVLTICPRAFVISTTDSKVEVVGSIRIMSLAGFGYRLNLEVSLFSSIPVVLLRRITVPSAKTAINPKAAPFWFAAGSRNPEARTTAEPPPSAVNGALKLATIVELSFLEHF